LFFACDDLIAADNTYERRVEKARGDDLARACAATCAEGEMLNAGADFFAGWVDCTVGGEPAFGIED
jgi:hypothetical protein